MGGSIRETGKVDMTVAVVEEREQTGSQSGPYQRYRKTLLSPERVRELSTLRPRRVVLDAVGCWVLIVASWAMVAWKPTWWTVLAAFCIVGTRYYALFIIGHDGMHRRLFSRIRTNDLFADLFIYGPVGVVTRINNRNHFDHHQHLATDLDPDRHKHGCFNKANALGLVSFLTGFASVFKSLAHVFLFAKRTENDGSEPYTLRDVAILVGWQVLLIGGLTWTIGWWTYPALWLAPVYVFAFLGDNFRSFAEHSHAEPDHEADEHRLITYLSNPIERLVVAPMNMNYHATHHLWPSIPYYNLPKADGEIRAMPEAQGLEWRTSYFGYLLRYYLALPLHDCVLRSGGKRMPESYGEGIHGARERGNAYGDGGDEGRG